MKTSHLSFLAAAIIAASPSLLLAQVDTKWKIHDLTRPVPPVVDPGSASTQDSPGHPPSDAVVLFDGTDLSKWQYKDGTPAKWKVENGYAEVVAKTGFIYTKQSFGDYEVQVLDSYENKTYADGQASALYGQYPPLVNASRPPGQWQWYDIVFHGPRFDADGKLLRPARVTVFHNGVFVQDNVELSGPTAHGQRPPYKAQPDKLPLALQDHGNPVRFRNIWIRELN